MYKIVLFILLLVTNSIANPKEAKNSGFLAGQSAISNYGSKKALNKSVAPLQSTGDITTIDGKTSFNAKIGACAENNEAIKVVFIPKENNVIDIKINQDLQAKSSYDYSYDINNVTAICTGAVRLTNEEYYKFTFDKFSKKIAISSSNRAEAGYCFCILNSCQYGGYRKDIADKVVGDLIGVISSSGITNYQTGINKYNEELKTYYMYVKNNEKCKEANMGNSYTNVNPTSYYQSQTTNPISMSDVASKDKDKSDSLYYVTGNLNTTAIASKNNNSLHDIKIKNEQVCTITKTPFLDDDGNIQIDIKDNCIANYSCSLHREEICDSLGKNCIDRILNKVLTSYNIPLQCQIFNDKYKVCANGDNFSTLSNTNKSSNFIIHSSVADSYFYIKRHYNCGTQTITHDTSKTNLTMNSVNKSGSTMSYTDFEGKAQNIEIGEFENCQIRYCRVKIDTKHTTVYSDGTSNAQTKDGVSTIEYEFKRCNTIANGSYICPTEANEKEIEACSCNPSMNAASMAIGYANAIEDAVKDFSCSSN